MATTIKVRPLGLAPTYNETIVVLESDFVALTDFKWIIDIYQGAPADTDYTLLSSIVILPNPDGFGVIDFHRHIENHITTDFYPADKDEVISRIIKAGFKWSFRVAEQYSGNPPSYQVFGIDETTIFSFNGALSFQGFRGWLASDYNMNSTSPTTTKFLTDIPRVYNVTLEDRVWLNGLQNDISNPPILGHITTDNGTYGVDNQFNATGQNFLVQHKIGAKDLTETTDTSLVALTGSLPAVDSNTTFITYTQNTLPIGTAISETITLNIVDKCSKHELIRFFYMDKLGSYLPVTFNKVSKTNITNTRSNYRQNYGSYDATSNVWGYTTYDRGNTTYDLVSSEKVTCTSDWMNESEVAMVTNMLNSPIVYIQDSEGNYVAVTITTNSYEVKKTVNDKLINYTLSFEYANTNTNQRG
tara:strand:- start:2741 stop:3985 length:1245 start_codon:yes stop_codon:yes gene_type:complete